MASTIKVDNVQNQPGTNIVSKCGTDVTLGASGDTVALASGASQTGFGRSGSVNWNTTKITADPANAVSGTGYFCDTSGGAFTVTLPTSPSAGDIVAVSDYTRTFGSNNLTIGRNSKPIGGIAGDGTLDVNGQSATFVFVDDTEGWINTQETQTTTTGMTPYPVASGGNQSPACGLVCGDYKTHIFTGPGTFSVASISGCAPRNAVDYVIVAGGGGTGGAADQQGGGGAGGFRMSNGLSLPAPLTSPLANPTGLTATATTYPIVVGGGGANGGGNSGNASSFSTIPSAGGGFGIHNTPGAAGSGGSGGGATQPSNSAGAGNTPPVSPSQGFPGGSVPCRNSPQYGSGGGGGAAAAGGGGNPGAAGAGGAGSFIDDNFIGPTAPSYGTPGPTSNTRYFAGGGGGGAEAGVGCNGGVGGGGKGTCNTGSVTNGTINTGGGAGSGNDSTPCGALGGSGVVMIRYRYQ